MPLPAAVTPHAGDSVVMDYTIKNTDDAAWTVSDIKVKVTAGMHKDQTERRD